jgi:hypothetical protein
MEKEEKPFVPLNNDIDGMEIEETYNNDNIEVEDEYEEEEDER